MVNNVILSTRNIDNLISDIANEVVGKLLRLQNEQDGKQSLEQTQWLDLEQLCNYLPEKPAKQTIYGYVGANKIPHHKTSKKLRFLKSEIDNWLLEGKVKTTTEIQADARDFLKNKKG